VADRRPPGAATARILGEQLADAADTKVRTAADEGRLRELLPFTGQSAALVHDIAPAGTDVSEEGLIPVRWRRCRAGPVP
jgi:hypothetical protein